MSGLTAFAYIVQQILNRRCVPVAGAGVSLASTHPTGERFHKVPWMVTRLKQELLRLRFNRYCESDHGSICSGRNGVFGCLLELSISGFSATATTKLESGCFFCDVVGAAKQNKLGSLSELYLWEVSNFDSYSCSSAAYVQLIELLRIKEYTTLEPAVAHHIIAMLAREGLIKEVITTNYDCNFEKAYGNVCKGPHADVISSLDDYRQYGVTGGELLPRLKIFKINGCATKLDHDISAENCMQILLTERQLQKWRNRQWAADIFKDRLRSRSLFFNGFGSDEPQIHHALQSVLDEYGDTAPKNKSSGSVFDKPTPPIVAIYESHPSFHQQQIVNTFALMHGLPARVGDELILRHPLHGSNLSADDLWQAIFERVYRQLLMDALQDSALSHNASFTAIVPFASSLLGEILSLFDESAKADESESVFFKTAAPAWLSHLKSFDGKHVGIDQVYTQFSRCLTVLKDPSAIPRYADLYMPVNENKALMSELMLLMFLLFQDTDGVLKCCAKRGLGFEVVQENEQDKKSLFVSISPSFPLAAIQSDTLGGNTDLIILLGQAGSFIQPQMYRMYSVGTDTITPSTAITLGWRHIFHDGTLTSIDAVRERLRDVVRTPSNYYYQSQPSLNQRTFLKPV